MPAAAPLAYIPLEIPKAYRRIIRQEGTIAFAKNTTSNPLRIDQSGLLLGLLLTFSGTATNGATAPILNTSNPYGLIKYVTLQTSGGVGRAINIPGYALNVVERTREADYVDGPANLNAVSSANVLSFSLHVPVCVRDGFLYGGYTDMLGAVFTGDPTLSVQVQLTFGDETSIFSTVNAAAVAGTVTVSSIKLDTPTPDKDDNLLRAISWTHQLVQEQVIAQGNNAGNVNILLPAAEPRVYLRNWLLMSNTASGYTNGILNTLDATLQDYIDFFQSMSEYPVLEMQRRKYIAALPPGTYVMDFASSNDRSQWLPVEKITLFKLIPNLVTPGAGCQIEVYSESVVPSPLARQWVASAAASRQGNKVRAA